MSDNNQNSNNSQTTQQANQSPAQNSNTPNPAISTGWVTVNTSNSVEALRMDVMKGNDNVLITKDEG